MKNYLHESADEFMKLSAAGSAGVAGGVNTVIIMRWRYFLRGSYEFDAIKTRDESAAGESREVGWHCDVFATFSCSNGLVKGSSQLLHKCQ
jgi:hypothetical protein